MTFVQLCLVVLVTGHFPPFNAVLNVRGPKHVLPGFGVFHAGDYCQLEPPVKFQFTICLK